jgi:V/A-type H+-transporting ATPase subunit C
VAGDYGYGNARIRAMKASLLGRRDYEALLSAGSVEGLIEALLRTDYAEEIKAALVREGGVQCVNEGMRRNVVRTVGAIPGFFDGRPRELVRRLVARWDLHNLIAILRGQARGVSAQEIHSALVAAGELKEIDLRAMIQQPTIQATAELMLAWRLPYAAALAGALREADGDLVGVETELYRCRFRDALIDLGAEANEMLVREMLELEIDVANLSLLIRLAAAGDQRPRREGTLRSVKTAALPIEGGRISSGLLQRLGAAPDVETVVKLLAGSAYASPLQDGLEKYLQSSDAAVLERALERTLVLSGIRMLYREPLSIATVIGYLWAKCNEVVNLRLIAQGKALGWRAEMIREEMIWWTWE